MTDKILEEINDFYDSMHSFNEAIDDNFSSIVGNKDGSGNGYDTHFQLVFDVTNDSVHKIVCEGLLAIKKKLNDEFDMI